MFDDEPTPLEPGTRAWRQHLVMALSRGVAAAALLAVLAGALLPLTGLASPVASALAGALGGAVAGPAGWLGSWAERRRPTKRLFFGVGLVQLALGALAGATAVAELVYAQAMLATGSADAALRAVGAVVRGQALGADHVSTFVVYLVFFGLPLAAATAGRVRAFGHRSLLSGADGAVMALAAPLIPTGAALGVLIPLLSAREPERGAVILGLTLPLGVAAAAGPAFVAVKLLVVPLHRVADRLARPGPAPPETGAEGQRAGW